MGISQFKKLFDQEKEKILEEYFTFLRFETISADSAYHAELEKCAQWLFHYLKQNGLNVEKWEMADAPPVLFAQDLRAGPDKDTLLLYCHYDVQPVDPLEEWSSPPFEPSLRNGQVYARGASDNKGQCFYTITALRMLLKQLEKLPINLKLIIEGEEESGSAHLPQLIHEKKEALKADYLLIVDSGIEKRESPAITLGARGLVCMQVTLKESNSDLHSGMTGGVVYNPNKALVEMLAKLHDTNGKVAVPGFYDEILPISAEEKKEIQFEFDAQNFHSLFGFTPEGREKNVPINEACWLRPTLEINGMWGGYTGAGFKTVIPAKAYAKLSCRLVPHQDPDKTLELVSKFLHQLKPKGLELKVEKIKGSGRGFRSPAHSRAAHIFSKSYSEVFEKPCKNILMGGSIPIAAELGEVAEADIVLIGVALPGDRIHAPNEHFNLDLFEKGYLTICRAIELFDSSE